MNLVRIVSMVGLGALAAAHAGTAGGCSSTSSVSASTSPLGGPPERPGASTTMSAEEHNFAMDAIFVGDTDRTGAPSVTAWKAFGFDIDGKVSDKTSTDVCTPAQGAGTGAQVDGDNGIDNAFGSQLVPLLASVAMLQSSQRDLSSALSESFRKGRFTVMLDVKGLTADAAQTNIGLSGQLLAGGTLDNPTFSSQDTWPVRPELLADGRTIASGSVVRFPDAFVVNGTWVSGANSTVALSLVIGGYAFDLTIHHATIAFDHRGANAENGTVAGVIATAELIAELKKVAGHVSTSLCSASVFESIAQQIRQASDILTDGTNRAGVPCDAISIGVGFTAKEIALPTTVAAPARAAADPCADGGVTGGGADAATGAAGTD